MATASTLLGSLLPAALFVAGTANRCELSTDSGTGELHLTGRVNFLEVENGRGCWQIVATDGGRYELWPEQAPASVLRHGLRVALVVHVNEERASVCRVGTPVDVWRVVQADVEN